jgi:hypothetical protein
VSVGEWLRRYWWRLLPILTIGILSGPAFLYGASRSRSRQLLIAGVVYGAVAVVYIVMTAAAADGSALKDIGAGIGIANWFVSTGHAFLARKPYDAALGLGRANETPVEAARRRLAHREELRRLAATEPAVARELGVGRPDLPDADHGDLIDVNSAPVEVLTLMDGIDEATARRIAEVRAQVGGFISVEDLGVAADLDGDLVDRIRADAVFLPR